MGVATKIPEPTAVSASERWRGLLRLALGTAIALGANASILLLFSTRNEFLVIDGDRADAARFPGRAGDRESGPTTGPRASPARSMPKAFRLAGPRPQCPARRAASCGCPSRSRRPRGRGAPATSPSRHRSPQRLLQCSDRRSRRGVCVGRLGPSRRPRASATAARPSALPSIQPSAAGRLRVARQVAFGGSSRRKLRSLRSSSRESPIRNPSARLSPRHAPAVTNTVNAGARAV